MKVVLEWEAEKPIDRYRIFHGVKGVQVVKEDSDEP
jgi:hypothetical protein